MEMCPLHLALSLSFCWQRTPGLLAGEFIISIMSASNNGTYNVVMVNEHSAIKVAVAE